MTDAAPRRSGPVATIDHRALRANVERLLLRADDQYAVADLRHDAWGHGLRPVARTLAEAGVDAFIVDEGEAEAMTGDFSGVAVSAAGGATLDGTEIYGLSAAGPTPVMRLSGFVLLTKELRAGEGVSYGYTHRAAHDTRVALVTGGYAQGIVRGLGDRVSVAIGPLRCPIVGRVAMDVCVVDIGDGDVARGDAVVFFGPADGDPALSDWTDATGLSAAEIVTAVGLRAQREHIA
ncbi:alanine racemase [Microbacterium sp. 4R-513]|nr:alanine racemase [Microbacterium sp. 4R-513]